MQSPFCCTTLLLVVTSICSDMLRMKVPLLLASAEPARGLDLPGFDLPAGWLRHLLHSGSYGSQPGEMISLIILIVKKKNLLVLLLLN